MEKSILARRKAQKLARDGQSRLAVDEMRRLLAEGEVDPYDHVYLGDLLMRVGENEEAVSAYSEAVRSYETVGLFRNAIAVGKRVLRIDGSRARIHRTLGELYDREGLKSEAVPHYLAYLDSFRGEALPPEEFFETLERTSSLTGHQTEVALRLVEHFVRVRQGDRAAGFLREVAAQVELNGTPDLAEELRRRADEVAGMAPAHGAVSAHPAATAPPAMEPPTGIEISAENDDVFIAALPPPLATVNADTSSAAAIAAADLSARSFDILDFGDRDLSALPAADAPETPADEDGGETSENAAPVFEIAADEAPMMESVVDLERERPPEVEMELETSAETAAHTPAHIAEHTAEHTPGIALTRRAEDAFVAEDWDTARSLYQQLHRADPEHRAHLGRLVEISHKQNDPAGETLYLGFLGDIWIQEGAMERAVNIFRDILRIDPENQTAQRRLKRLRELGIPGAGPHLPGRIPNVLDSGDAIVDVKDEKDRKETEEWLDLAGLLEEFKAGLENHVDASDFQAHYDLAVSHQQMGLLEEALEELDRVFACTELPGTVEQPARELRGLCLMGLSRSREAIHEFREAVEKATSVEARRTSLYHLARAYESAEEWVEAGGTFGELVSEAHGFLDAEARWQHCRQQAAAASSSSPSA